MSVIVNTDHMRWHCGQLMRYEVIENGDVFQGQRLTGTYYCEQCSTMQPTYEDSRANQWYGREFCPHADAPCIDGCSFCGRGLEINEHNHTPEGFPVEGEGRRYECVCFNC